jgi:two-component system KDP operon response regulator KdpE
VTSILVVDDEPQIRRALRVNLEARDFRVLEAVDGESALHVAAEQRPDLALVDLGLPGISGLDVIAGIRGWSDLPIIVLSVRGAESDKIEALDAGADDYVTKPFGMGELLARVRAALRRRSPDADEPVVQTAAFEIDLAEHRALVDGIEVHLTPTEWALVGMLVRHPGRLVTQRHLLHEVWGPGYDHETNYLRVHLANVRRKLEPVPSQPRYFITEPGMGYRFQPDAPERDQR